MTTYESWTNIYTLVAIIVIIMAAIFLLASDGGKRDKKEHKNIFCGIKDLRI